MRVVAASCLVLERLADGMVEEEKGTLRRQLVRMIALKTPISREPNGIRQAFQKGLEHVMSRELKSFKKIHVLLDHIRKVGAVEEANTANLDFC